MSDHESAESDKKVHPSTLIKNAKIFDGVSDTLIEGQDVLVTDGMIAQIASDIAAPEGAKTIDADGRVMTPGFIYSHEHVMLQARATELLFGDDRYIAILGAHTLKQYFERGITTVRDMGGNTFGVKTAIDRGITPGPRLYQSGAMISQTSGHADHLAPSQPTAFMAGGRPDRMVETGDMLVVDGVPAVLHGARSQIRRGASQVKIAVSGGTGSISDPMDCVQYTPEEIQAAVMAATDYGTYVVAHAYNNASIRRAIDNGVLSIEHANLVDRETLQYMKDKGAWLSPQVTVYTFIPPGYTPVQVKKHREAMDGMQTLFEMAAEIGYEKIVVGTDIIADPERILTLLGELKHRTKWFSNAEVLRQATSKGGELMGMSGMLNPYPGKLGVIEEGAHADILLFGGNPLEDMDVVVDFETNMHLIMKAGEIYRNDIG